MSRPQISATAVLMTAAHLFSTLYAQDPDATDTMFTTRQQDFAMEDCAKKAWRLASAVEAFAPAEGQIVKFTRPGALRPAALEQEAK